MSSNNSKDDVWSGEQEVSQAYEHAGFQEEPPPEVDRAILAAARRHRSRRALTPWLAPAALAATVLLSLSIVIRLGLIGADDPDLSGLGSAGVEEAEQAVDETEAQLPAQSGPARASSAGEGQTSPGAAPAAQEALRALQTAPSEPAPVSQTQESAPGAASSSAVRDRVAASCEALSSEPEAWLQCIATLLDSGATELAASELADFRASYPDYPLPADLQIP